MKIIYNSLSPKSIERMSLIEFADKYNLTLQIDEDYDHIFPILTIYRVKFIGDFTTLTEWHYTPEAAIRRFVERISNTTLRTWYGKKIIDIPMLYIPPGFNINHYLITKK